MLCAETAGRNLEGSIPHCWLQLVNGADENGPEGLSVQPSTEVLPRVKGTQRPGVVIQERPATSWAGRELKSGSHALVLQARWR